MIGEIVVRHLPGKPSNRGYIALIETDDGLPLGRTPITAKRVRVIWSAPIRRPYDLQAFLPVLTALVTAYDTTV